MTATELEAKYVGHIREEGSLRLLASDDAIRLLDDCATSEIRFLGVEAFRLFNDGGVQPAMEYSNISFGKIEERDGKLEVTAFERSLRSPWAGDLAVYEKTKALIREGTSNGYSWYEVSVEDPNTNELLFFR
jgi:hypothetical protein